jgi:quinol monooxygenase YgiN
MVIVTIQMNVRPAKQKELLQTIAELTEAQQGVRGFLGMHVLTDADDSNKFTLLEEWDTSADVTAYMQSEYFQILRGALRILTVSAEIEIVPDNRGRGAPLDEKRTNGLAYPKGIVAVEGGSL